MESNQWIVTIIQFRDKILIDNHQILASQPSHSIPSNSVGQAHCVTGC